MSGQRLIIGLTGGIGSGKSKVGTLFEAHGVTVIDADEISRSLTAAGGGAMPAIAAAFGAEFVDPQGALDRSRMRTLVFSDPAAKARLEAILHPIIRAETDRRIAAATSDYVILMIPLLVESGRARERCDRIVVVDCPEEIQIERVMRRDQLPRAQVEAIMAAQVARADRLAAADDTIDNGGSPDALPAQVERLHGRYVSLARDRRRGIRGVESGHAPDPPSHNR